MGITSAKYNAWDGQNQNIDCVIDGDLITAKHPAFTDELIDLYIKEIET